MAASAAYQRKSFPYTPLKNSEIRLIKIEKRKSSSADRSYELKHYELDKKPPYFALSYVWGDPNKTKAITVNGHAFDNGCGWW
jgi:hypothetical protein